MRSLIPYIFCFGLLFVLTNCGQKERGDSHSLRLPDIPKLLDRNKALQHGKEWETVQSLYGQYRQQLMQKPEALEPLLKLAELFINEARITGEHGHYYPAAMQMADRILSKSLTEKEKDLKFRTLYTKAGIQLSLHDFQHALETGQQALALNPYNAGIYGVLVDAHVELGQYEKAVEMADKMVSIRPDLRSYSRVSYLREIYGQPQPAIEAMEMAVEAGFPGQEHSCWARLTLAQLHEHYGKIEQAEMQYQLILSERPDYPFAIAGQARLAFQKGNYEEAENLLKKACDVIPEVGFYEQLAALYQKTGRNADFDRTMKAIWEMLADDVAHGHNMNLEYAALHRDLTADYEKALTYAMKEYELRPNNIDVNRLLSSIYQQMGQTEKARNHFEKASRTGSKHPDLLGLKEGLASI